MLRQQLQQLQQQQQQQQQSRDTESVAMETAAAVQADSDSDNSATSRIRRSSLHWQTYCMVPTHKQQQLQQQRCKQTTVRFPQRVCCFSDASANWRHCARRSHTVSTALQTISASAAAVPAATATGCVYGERCLCCRVCCSRHSRRHGPAATPVTDRQTATPGTGSKHSARRLKAPAAAGCRRAVVRQTHRRRLCSIAQSVSEPAGADNEGWRTPTRRGSNRRLTPAAAVAESVAAYEQQRQPQQHKSSADCSSLTDRSSILAARSTAISTCKQPQ